MSERTDEDRVFYYCRIIARKIAAVVSVCAGFALVHLLCQFSNITELRLEKNAVPLLIVLLSILFLVLNNRWFECFKRLLNCGIVDWIGIFSFIAILESTYHFFHNFSAEYCWTSSSTLWLTIVLFAVTILCRVLRFLINQIKICISKNKREKNNDKPTQRHISELSAEELIEWAQNDEPAKEVDYFEFTHKAAKIAKRLKGSIKAKGNAAIGLRGQYGSGKSTVTNFVKRELKREPNRSDIIFAHASCWGFSDVQSVQEYVVKEIIEAMTEAGIDTDHLVGIPKQYVRALAKAHTFFEAMLEFFFDERTPEKILKEIDDTLCGNGKKLVLILEDLDRSEEKEFRDPVFATLWRLRNTKHISFIITGFYKQPGEEDPTDYAKICDYVEEMPMITLQQKKDIFSKIAKYHTEKFRIEDINLSSDINHIDSVLKSQSCFDYLNNIDPPWNDIFNQVETPRNLSLFEISMRRGKNCMGMRLYGTIYFDCVTKQ